MAMGPVDQGYTAESEAAARLERKAQVQGSHRF